MGERADKYRLNEEYDVIAFDDDAGERVYLDGFGIKAILGGLFVGFLIAPASMYIGLVIGGTLTQPANWVTIILFMLIARRLRTTLNKQEMYVIYQVAGGVMGFAAGGVALMHLGQMFQSFIWGQYYMQSPAAQLFEIADQVPKWVAPPTDSEAYDLRQLLHRDWWPHLTIMGITIVWNRLNFYSLGYAMFRLTSDIERLPFPMAPIATEGITALAESDKETWRWTCFTVGGAMGIAFGAIYVGIPVLSGLFFNDELKLIEIPFIDYTSNTEHILPAVPMMLSTHIGIIFTGFVLPFWIIVGTAIAAVIGQGIGNPILYKLEYLKRWEPGMPALDTGVANSLDFWMSFSIGTAIAVAIIGIYTVIRQFSKGGGTKEETRRRLVPPRGRGDIPLIVSLGLFVVSTTGTAMLCHYLVPKFPIWILLVLGFVYTPLVSYVSARMIGLTGHAVSFPMLREATFVLTGYKGVDIWWAPIPMGNAGGSAQWFRQMELTGTKIYSMFKAQLVEIPIALVVSLLFWGFIWKMGEIPSSAYDYAQQYWPRMAVSRAIWHTATTTGDAFFLSCIKPPVILGGAVFGVVGFAVLSIFGLPTLLIYGVIRGLTGNPLTSLVQLTAACVGRFYFARKFGRVEWRRYTYILAAGFACGCGLASMVPSAARLIAAALTELPF